MSLKDLDEMLVVAGDLAEQEGRADLAALLHGGIGVLPPLPRLSSTLGMYRCTSCGRAQMGWFVYLGYMTEVLLPKGWRWSRHGGSALRDPIFFCDEDKCQKAAQAAGATDDGQKARDAYSGPWGQ